MHFTVGLSSSTSFVHTIKFDKIITNVGGGYIDDDNNADYGKFIAPRNGTYQFNANFYNGNKLIGGDLIGNGILIIGGNNGGGGPASLSAILDLKEGDKVYVQRFGGAADDTLYDLYHTSFSGFLIV